MSKIRTVLAVDRKAKTVTTTSRSRKATKRTDPTGQLHAGDFCQVTPDDQALPLTAPEGTEPEILVLNG